MQIVCLVASELVAGIGEPQYTAIQPNIQALVRYEGTRQGQIPGTKVLGRVRYQAARYSAGANCLLGGFSVPAGVHDRIPSDSCKSRFNITALKRPTSVQQCP